MPDKSTIETIIKNTPLAVVIIGLLLFVIGAAGGWPNPQLQVNELGWRIALAAMGAIVTGTGGLLLWRERVFWNSEDLASCKKYGVKIVSPDREKTSDVDPNFEISGTCQGQLPNNSLQVFAVYDKEYWPIMKPGAYSVAKGVWRAYVEIGGNPGPRTVVVAVGGRAAQAMYRYFWRVAKKEDKWVSIDELTPDVIECDRVYVYRK